MFVLLPQQTVFSVFLLGSYARCMDVVALFIKRGESLFRERHHDNKRSHPPPTSSSQGIAPYNDFPFQLCPAHPPSLDCCSFDRYDYLLPSTQS
jgi:hypothetical protein